KEHKGDMDIAGFLDFNPKPAEEILKEITDAGMSMELPDLLAELIGLCVEGRAKQVTGSHFVKVHER
ncbi:MAG: hypothetical protein K2N55_08890, partial [Lachnospiraceae bacterium]|nr:hypothetical protein [Lachnospiraceae bacterium]